MALTLDCPTTEVYELGDFMDRVRRTVKPGDLDSLAECSVFLKALANNRKVITQQLNRELGLWKDFQAANRYTAQTMLLGAGDNFRIRANIWTPLSSYSVVREEEEKLFFYRVPHDHNFSFLTIGYFGPGYETTIYEYDQSSIIGMPGEHVRLEFLERTSLPEGKVMLYRAGRDIHSQEHAPDLSVSINLLVDTPEVKTRSQFFFDLDSNLISGVVPTPPQAES